MTNEEIVEKIQSGKTEYITNLWESVSRFIDMQAGQYLDSFPQHYRSLRGDMVNQAYFSFLTAIEKYEQERGTFLFQKNKLGWVIKSDLLFLWKK